MKEKPSGSTCKYIYTYSSFQLSPYRIELERNVAGREQTIVRMARVHRCEGALIYPIKKKNWLVTKTVRKRLYAGGKVCNNRKESVENCFTLAFLFAVSFYSQFGTENHECIKLLWNLWETCWANLFKSLCSLNLVWKFRNVPPLYMKRDCFKAYTLEWLKSGLIGTGPHLHLQNVDKTWITTLIEVKMAAFQILDLSRVL